MSGNTNTDIWIAGAFAAFTVDLLVYPLDTLKTRIQSPQYKTLYLNEGTNTIKKAALFRGLYQGIGGVVLATLPSSGAFFTTYEAAKSLLTRYNPSTSSHPNGLIPIPFLHSVASGIAECVSCAILTPAEVIKQNAQMVSKSSISASGQSATRQTLRKFRSNPLALWRGYGALAGRNLPFTALQFPMFEKLREKLKAWRVRTTMIGTRRRSEDDIPIWESGIITAFSAGSAGAVSAVVTTPIDVVKTRIMLAAADDFAQQKDTSSKLAVDAIKEGKVIDAVGQLASPDSQEEEQRKKQEMKPKSSWAIGKEVVRDQGWRGLFRGGALRGAWTMFGAGLYLGVYESGRIYLERKGKGKDGRDEDS